jgi:S-disulfanyl-L-cysteine oxidoreductase SoxD
MACRVHNSPPRAPSSPSLFVLLLLITVTLRSGVTFAQTTTPSLGRTPTAAELRAIDIEVLPDGRGLPDGQGTAQAGRVVYERHCRSCHGATGTEGPNDAIAGGRGSLTTMRPVKTVGS